MKLETKVWAKSSAAEIETGVGPLEGSGEGKEEDAELGVIFVSKCQNKPEN